jgi:hypothetical protein
MTISGSDQVDVLTALVQSGHKTSKLFVSHQEDFMAGHVSVKLVF